MAGSKVEQFRDLIIGLRPVYSSAGNCTEILLEDGRTIPERRILKSTVLALTRSYGLDLTAQRTLVRSWIKKQTLVPFYLSSERVFIPLKMRQSRAGNDETYGYLDVRTVQDINELGKRRCRLSLNNGLLIEILSSPATALQSQHCGRQLLAMLGYMDNSENEENNASESAKWMVRTLKKITLQLERIENKL